MSDESVNTKRSLGRRSRTVLIGVGIALGATVVSAVAFAAWTTTGSGTAAGKAGTAASVTINHVVPAGDLYPGADGTAAFTVTNNNGYAVNITQLTFSTQGITVTPDPSITVPSGAQGCVGAFLNPPIGVTASSNNTYTVKVPAGETIIVPAKTTTSQVFTLPKAFSLSTGTPDSCQGASFTVKVVSVLATSA